MFIEVVCLYLMSVMRVASGDVVQDPQGYISPAQQEVHYDIKYYNPEEVLEEHHGYDVVTEVTSAYIQVSYRHVNKLCLNWRRNAKHLQWFLKRSFFFSLIVALSYKE